MYLSNIWRSLQIPLINCKIYLGSKWIEGESVKFKITDAKIHVPIITLSTKNNVNLTNQLSNEFKTSVCWNNYQNLPANVINNDTSIYELLTASFQGVRRLFCSCFIRYFRSKFVRKHVNRKRNVKSWLWN